jgi:hypothetical protein
MGFLMPLPHPARQIHPFRGIRVTVIPPGEHIKDEEVV